MGDSQGQVEQRVPEAVWVERLQRLLSATYGGEIRWAGVPGVGELVAVLLEGRCVVWMKARGSSTLGSDGVKSGVSYTIGVTDHHFGVTVVVSAVTIDCFQTSPAIVAVCDELFKVATEMAVSREKGIWAEALRKFEP